MLLDRYLTDYDDSLTGESYIDPMGTLVIWSAYGQKIFQNRVNSISNDVRNYTLNLFNHYLIRRVIDDERIQLSRNLQNEYGGKNTLYFKYACLLHLENLFVFSILRHEENKGVDSAGVLGSYKARRIWTETDGDPEIIFTHGKDGQILVRQLGLGVSGRYKTPMIEIGYFDNNYHYDQPNAVQLWQHAEKFVASNNQLSKLADSLIAYFKELLCQKKHKPQIYFSEVPELLHKGFASAYASAEAVGSYAREHWLTVTGLDGGAAGALLQVLDENAAKDTPLILDAKTLMSMALKKDLAADERLKLQHITELEPFLSDVMLLFTLLAAKKSRPVEEVITQWKLFGRDEHSLPQRARQLSNDTVLLSVLTGTSRWRMKNLLLLAGTASLDEQITLLLDYHNKVMAVRGQIPWLTVNNDGLVKVHVRPMRIPAVEDWQPGDWYHSYYLPQFKSLVRGFQGIEA